jgi:predicted nucleotidyltransferase
MNEENLKKSVLKYFLKDSYIWEEAIEESDIPLWTIEDLEVDVIGIEELIEDLSKILDFKVNISVKPSIKQKFKEILNE